MSVRLDPFPGVRYSDAGEMANLYCPPYDVISPEEQERFHERHPHNAIRLELARPDPGPGADRYRGVAEVYGKWLTEGVLVREPEPAFYVYRQDFVDPDGNRRRVAGVIGALALQEFGDTSGVLPHERTMPGPKEDRLALLRACPVNFSPIFAIHRGGGGLAPFFDSLEDRPPAARFVDTAETLHRLWVVTRSAETAAISDAVAPGPLVIADGHHRYETALEFHREQSEPGPHEAIMCFCVDADAEGLVVLPYHRAPSTARPADEVAEDLRTVFKAADVEGSGEGELASSTADHPMLFVFPDRNLLVELEDADVVAVVGERAPAWRALDVVALHEVVLPKVAPGADEIVFSRDPDEVRRIVAEGRARFGVLLRALTAPQVVDVASSGERMPQKASYFWPKAVTGLVFRQLR